MTTEIKTYLKKDKRNYDDGVKLLSQHHKNRQLINFLQKKETDSNREKLEYELAKLADYTPEKPEITVIPLQPKISAVPELTEEEKETEISRLESEMNTAYVQRCQLSNELADLPEDQLKSKVDEIKAKKDEYNALFLRAKAIRNGFVPGQEHPDTDAEKKTGADKVINPEIAVLKQEIQPLREKASKLRAKIKKSPKNAKIKEWETELAQTEKGLEELEREKKILEAGN